MEGNSREGVQASVVLLLSGFLPPEEADGYEVRHIASVSELAQELMEHTSPRGGNQLQELMTLRPQGKVAARFCSYGSGSEHDGSHVHSPLAA